MNIGTVVTPNTKGQVVIPKKIRDNLGIDENTSLNIRVVDDGIYIHPGGYGLMIKILKKLRV